MEAGMDSLSSVEFRNQAGVDGSPSAVAGACLRSLGNRPDVIDLLVPVPIFTLLFG